MTKLQKQAWSNLFGIAVFCPLLTVLFTLMSVKIFGKPLSIEWVTQVFAICTVCIFVPAAQNALYVFRKPKKWKGIYFDERDQLIHYKAILYVFYALCTFLLVGFVVIPSAIGQIGYIPFYVLPLCLCGIAIFVVLSYSIAILIQYGWGVKDGQQ
jgi:hypothetical protein